MIVLNINCDGTSAAALLNMTLTDDSPTQQFEVDAEQVLIIHLNFALMIVVVEFIVKLKYLF